MKASLGFLCAGLAAALIVSVPAQAESKDSFSGKVLAVSDGDTLLVGKGNSAVSIDLVGIDAPELGQEFGYEARKFLTKTANRKKVTVEIGEWIDKRAAVGRILVDGQDLSEILIREGLAWTAPDRSKNQTLETAQGAARDAQKGLWSKGSPQPPWEYRSAQTSAGR